MAFALLIAIWLLTLASAFAFTHNWLPTAASAHAAAIDRLLWINFAALGAVFVVTQITLATFVWRYRASARSTKTKPLDGRRAEWFAVIAAAVIFVGLNLYGSARLRDLPPPVSSRSAESVRVEVTGVQFRWYFRYPGADGKFGRTKRELVDASLGNPLGLDPTDPDGKDDRVTPSLQLPAGQDAEIILHAQDVIHSFFVAALRVKQDAVPGMEIHIHIAPQTPGTYEIACAELCGLGHYSMNAKLNVLAPDAYRAWLNEIPSIVAKR